MKKLYLLILLLSACKICDGQNGFQESIWVPDSNLFAAHNVLALPDSGFLILYHMQELPFSTTSKDFILKINSSGSIVWQKVIYTDSVINLRYINYASNGYLITGQNRQQSSPSSIIVINIDFNGDTLWTRSYPQTGIGRFIKQMSNGDLLIIGNSNGNSMVMRTDSLGSIIYYNSYPGNWFGDLTGIATSDGGSLLYDPGLTFRKIDSVGNLMWTTPQFNLIGVNGLTETYDSCYMVIASSFTSEAILIKVNNSGDTIWARSMGNSLGTTGVASIIPLSDGGFAVCGHFYYANTNYTRPLLIRIDSSANVLWSKTYIVANNAVEGSYAISITNDNGFIIAGLSRDTIQDKYSGILIKTDSIGNSSCPSYDANIVNVPVPLITETAINIPSIPQSTSMVTIALYYQAGYLSTTDSCAQPISINEINIDNANSSGIFPNPFRNNLNITTSFLGPNQLTLYDLTLRKVLLRNFSKSINLDTENLAKGIYIYVIRSKDGIISQGKVVKD